MQPTLTEWLSSDMSLEGLFDDYRVQAIVRQLPPGWVSTSAQSLLPLASDLVRDCLRRVVDAAAQERMSLDASARDVLQRILEYGTVRGMLEPSPAWSIGSAQELAQALSTPAYDLLRKAADEMATPSPSWRQYELTAEHLSGALSGFCPRWPFC